MLGVKICSCLEDGDYVDFWQINCNQEKICPSQVCRVTARNEFKMDSLSKNMYDEFKDDIWKGKDL